MTRSLQRNWIFCRALKAHLEDGKLAITYETEDEEELAWLAEYNLLTGKAGYLCGKRWQRMIWQMTVLPMST